MMMERGVRANTRLRFRKNSLFAANVIMVDILTWLNRTASPVDCRKPPEGLVRLCFEQAEIQRLPGDGFVDNT